MNLITITAIDPDDSKQKKALKQKSEPYKNPIINSDIPKSNSKTDVYNINSLNRSEKNK